MRRNAELGRRIRHARHAAGLSLIQAGGTGLSQPHLSLIERGKRGISAEVLLSLCERLGVQVDQLLPPGLDPDDAEELLRAAEALVTAGEYSRAVPALRELLAVLPADRPAWRARCLIKAGLALVRLRQYEFAASYIQEGTRLAEETGDPQLVARAYNTLGLYHLEQSSVKDALRVLEAGRRVVGQHLGRKSENHAGILASILTNLGQAYRKLGELEKAVVCYAEAAHIARANGDTFRLGAVARNAAAVLTRLHRYRDARRQLQLARHAFSTLGRRDLLVHVENGFGILYLEMGEVKQAIPHLERAIYLAAQVADDLGRARTLTELARAHLLLDHPDAAEPLTREAIRLSMKVNDAVEAARAETLRAAILAARGHLREAEAALQFVIPIFEEREQHKDLVDAYRVLGRVLQATDRHAQASDILRRAVELARECLSTP